MFLVINNKGQSLVLFILIIPILIGIMVIVIDCGKVFLCKNRQENVLTLALEYGLTDEKNTVIEDILDKNFDDGEHKVVWNGDKVSIVVHEKVNGVFSSLFGFSTFDVVSQYQGSVIEGKKRIEKVK